MYICTHMIYIYIITDTYTYIYVYNHRYVYRYTYDFMQKAALREQVESHIRISCESMPRLE